MSENLRKLIGVAVLVGIVVVGIVATNDDDSDFTRNLAIPGASPLLEDQEDLRFELLERRIADVEKLLAKEQLAELAALRAGQATRQVPTIQGQIGSGILGEGTSLAKQLAGATVAGGAGLAGGLGMNALGLTDRPESWLERTFG